MKSIELRWSGAVAALVIAFGIGIMIAYSTASAQGRTNNNRGFQQPNNQNQRRLPDRRGYASGIAIGMDVQYVFVAEGGWVYKLNKSDLSVAAHGALRPVRSATGTPAPQGQVVPPAQQPPPPPMVEEAPPPADDQAPAPPSQ